MSVTAPSPMSQASASVDQADAAQKASRAQLDNLAALSGVHDSIEALRILADSLPQMVWITRADGFTEYYNRRWWDYTGLTYAQACGDGWSMLLHPDDKDRAIAQWQLSLQTGDSYEIEYRFRRAKDGEYRWFLGRGEPFRDQSGKIVRWFGTCTEIHDQKLAEQALRRAKDQMEAAARAKDQFLSTLSHELRTPLSAILGWVQLLEMNALDEAERVDAIKTIKEQAKLQSQLIEDLLEVSRIINGKFRMRDESVELHRVLTAAVDALKPSAAEKKQSLECLGLDKTIYVRGDAQRLQQVAWNLLTNAVKFTPEGGTIRVGLDRTDSNARLRVIDNGQGIEADILPKIFNRFSQADASDSRAHGGLGLGMSIVKHIVGLHRGTVTASSEGAGKGATFTVEIPIQAIRPDSSDTVAGQSHPSPDALEGKRLLVVDDEESARAVLDATLRTFGAHVTLASCVPDAIELLRTQDFDAVISDVAMPVQTGYDLVRLLRRDRSHASPLPVIALTAFASIDDQNAALDAGFDMHVSKPVEPLELISKVMQLLDTSVDQF